MAVVKKKADVKPAKKSAPKKAESKKVEAAKPEAKAAAPKPAKSASEENLVSLKSLCDELKLNPAVARRKLRNADLPGERTEKARWAWPVGSSALKEVSKLLGSATTT